MNSSQDTATPMEFINAVEEYYNISFKYDMAANSDNTKCQRYFTKEDNSLAIDWPTDGWCWLNPPFRNLTNWINKCHYEKERGVKIVSIWPLSGDINQIITWKNASVNIVHGRLWPTVRGLMLCKWDNSHIRNINGVIWNKVKLFDVWPL
jgi:phage N-6-adenine-methyltransferase